MIRNNDWHSTHYQWAIEHLHRLDAGVRISAEQDPVWPIEIFHGTTVGYKDGMRHDRDFGPAGAQVAFNARRRAYWHRTADHQHVIVGAETGEPRSRFFDADGIVLCQKDH